MSFFDRFLPSALIADLAPVQARSDIGVAHNVDWQRMFPDRFKHGNWYQPSVRQALGVPAILRCVTLISNTAGALSMNAIKDGVVVAPADRPRIVVRPNPLTTPGVFFRDIAYWKATYGEAWWWIAARDLDDYPISVVPIPPYEVKVDETKDPLRPKITWRDREIPLRDMKLSTLIPDPSNPYRGVGPLQLCGAAVSAAVESVEWAANFFSEGGYPSIVLNAETDFEDEDAATKFEEKWTSKPPNVPHVVTGIDGVHPVPVDQAGAQMLDARVHNFGEAALMFGVPGRMVEYMQSGSSISYTNTGEIFNEFVLSCLLPNYLGGAEEIMSDLLPRSWTALFDTYEFTRPDPKTRAEIDEIRIRSGVYDAAYAQKQEGILPGSIATAPVPPSPPQAAPPLLEMRAVDPEPVEVRTERGELRCDGVHVKKLAGIPTLATCGRLLSKSGVFVGRCPRCKKEYGAAVAA